MFSKAIFVTFLSLALSAYAAPANQKSEVCPSVSTVTVTALPSATTGATLVNTGNGSGRGGNNAGNGAAAGNGKGGKGGSKASSSAIAVSSVAVSSVAVSSVAVSSAVASPAVASSSAAPVATVRTGNNGNGRGGQGTGKGGNKASSVVSSVVATSAAAGTAIASSVVSSAAAAATSRSAASGNSNSSDPQTSSTLDPGVLATGFENNGQDVPTAGQVASLTSSNNFINFCLTVPNLPISNGLQVKTGSCNPAPMGIIAATTNMPSSKFQFPANFGTVKANTAFTIQMAISHLETGNFVNANENYFSAPQQINNAGDIQGHSHVVIEQIDSFQQTTATNPNVFAFFKGLNDAAQGGVLTADVTNGLPVGFYRLASINAAANHQPVLVAIAQHGSLDDMIYFSVTADGTAAGTGAGAGAGAAGNGTASATAATKAATAATQIAASASASASAATGKGTTQNTGGKGQGRGKRWFF